MNIKTVGVIGAGTMGSGIAQVFAQSGFAVRLVDVAQPMLDRARTTIDKSLAKFVQKGTLTAAQKDATRALFTSLDALAKREAILASNTSSISITVLGAATTRPDKVLGMHFMNPVPLMALVEMIRGHETSAESMKIAS